MPRKTKQNDITSPELLSSVNQENMTLKRDFLDYLRSIKRSENTIAGYENDLDIFFVWLLKNAGNKSFVKVTKRDIVAYQNWLINENKNSPARVRRLKSAISSLSNYIESILDDEYEGYRPIVRKVESPALQPTREKTVFDEEELEKFLKILVQTKRYEQACMVALAAYSGRRKAELCRFHVSDFSESSLVCGGALYKSALIQTKGRSGGKFIPCYTLAKKFWPYLELWMKERERLGIESEWLFPDRKDTTKQRNKGSLDGWAVTFSKVTGKDWYWHMLRHFFTTGLVRAGIPEGVIAKIVSWESTDMVGIYTDIDADEQIAMYFKDGDISVPEKKDLSSL